MKGFHLSNSPAEQKPQLYVVTHLDEPAPSRNTTGRKPKPKMPPLPQGLLDGMTELEQQHFWYFIDAYQVDYPSMKPTDVLCLYFAAMEYVNYLRVQAKQFKSGEVISMARQHPGVQMRAWLDMMDVTRKARTRSGKSTDDSEDVQAVKAALKSLSNAS
jgi:hypothetical protein